MLHNRSWNANLGLGLDLLRLSDCAKACETIISKAFSVLLFQRLGREQLFEVQLYGLTKPAPLIVYNRKKEK